MSGVDVGQQRLHGLLEDLRRPGQVERVRRRVADEPQQVLGRASRPQVETSPVDGRTHPPGRLTQRRVDLAVCRPCEPRVYRIHIHTDGI